MTKFFNLILLGTVLLCFYGCNTKETVRYLVQPLDHVNDSLLDTIKLQIEKEYGFNVSVGSSIPLPESAFINVKSPRYRADSLLKFLLVQKPDTIDFIIGITSKDISTSKQDEHGNIKKPISTYSDWGVMGLGYRPGQSSIVSTFRLKHKDPQRSIDRVKKIVIHEVGHNLSLKHCRYNDRCVMRDAAETVKTIDDVGFELCQTCKLSIIKK